MVTDTPQNWVCRGQIIQTKQKVDGLFIYQMEDFGIRLVPNS